jgi:hypothetical protein
MRNVEVGDIVQLDPEKTENRMFAACLMVVSEVKSWGVQGYVQGLGEKGEPGGQAYYRAAWGTFEWCVDGRAVWVVGSAAETIAEGARET